jgi:hypothetical protein
MFSKLQIPLSAILRALTARTAAVVLIRKNVGTQNTLRASLVCATATGSVTTSITTRLELPIFYILRSYDVLIPPAPA